MAEEVWRIIYSEEDVSGDAEAAPTARSKKQEEAAEDIKKSVPHWASAGKFAAGLLGSVGVIAFVFQMMRRSKIFSTFMDSFLMVLSSVVDLLMIPLIPLFGPVLKLLLKLIPLSMELSKKLEEFIKDPFKAIRTIFSGIGDAVKGIFDWFSGLVGADTLLGRILGDVGGELETLFAGIGNIWATAGEEISTIWGNEGLTTWEKISKTASSIWEAIGGSGKLAFETMAKLWNDIVIPVAEAFYNDTLVPMWNKFIDFLIADLPNWGWNIGEGIRAFFMGEGGSSIASGIGTAIRDFVNSALWAILGVAPPTGVSQLTKDTLAGIENTGTKGFILGGHVFESGFYKLHRGETVLSSGQTWNQYSKPINIQNIYNITGLREDFLADLKASQQDAMKYNEMRGYA